LTTQSEIESQIKMLLGGTIAEELIYAEVSTGASNDLERGTHLARCMVRQFGMSRLGRVCYQENGGPAFLGPGPGGGSPRDYSEETAREIDLEVRQIMDGAVAEVRALLQGRRAALEAVARRLIEKETMDGSELRVLLEQHPPGADGEVTANGAATGAAAV
jgi:cell division protease FtsH